MSAVSPQSRVTVRVNQGRDGVSPVVASMYCSPQPAALHIAPAARLREFCHYDSAPGEVFMADYELQTADGENKLSGETIAASCQFVAASDCISKPIRSF